MKIYLLQIKFFGELVNDTGTTVENIGVYKNKEQAKAKLLEIVNTDKNDNYVIDPAYEPIEDYALMFWNKMENWNCYYEIQITEMEVE